MNKSSKTLAFGNSVLNADNELPLSYQLRRSERAKKTRIIVTAETIEVVAPLKVSEHHIRSFVNAQQNWIRNAIRRIQEQKHDVKSLAPTQYIAGVTVPYQGKQIPLRIKPTSAKHIRVQLQSEEFVVYLPEYGKENSSDAIRQALENWMKQQIRQQAAQLITQHGTKHQLIPRQLRIKTQKTRWGSCGPKNDINLNWLLMLTPPVILEYVVVHELCHIKHKNHSKDFWQLVAEHMPDYLQHKRWLKVHGASIMRGL